MIANVAALLRLLVFVPLVVAADQGEEKNSLRANGAAESARLSALHARLTTGYHEVRGAGQEARIRQLSQPQFEDLAVPQAGLTLLQEALRDAQPSYTFASRFYVPLANLRCKKAFISLVGADAAHNARNWKEAVQLYEEAARQFDLARDAFTEANDVFAEGHREIDCAVILVQIMNHNLMMSRFSSWKHQHELLLRNYQR